MKVISIGTDRNVCVDGSAAQQRMIEYAESLGELHIVVFSEKKHAVVEKHIGNLHVYPTQSLSRWMYVYDAYMVACRVIKKIGCTKTDSIVTTQDPFETGLVGRVLAVRYDLPLQVQLHTDMYVPYFAHTLLNRIRRVIASFVLPRADGIRVVSGIVKDSLIEHFHNRIVVPDVLPIFVDIDHLVSIQPETDLKKIFPGYSHYVLLVSRVTKEKDIETPLRAFVSVVKKFPNAVCVVVGDGADMSRLKGLITELNIQKNIIFAGWQQDLSRYYSGADVFVNSSLYEGYAMTLVEAGALGCPIITTPVGIARDICHDGQNAFVCPVGDTECFARCTVDLLSPPDKRELFKNQMRDTIKGIRTTKDMYIATYIELLRNTIIRYSHQS
jgi:glycosyltransferase involved in cell wall biosynthesis